MSGGRSRFFNLIKQLRKRNFDVYVLQPQHYRTSKDNTVIPTSYYRNSIGKKTYTIFGDFNFNFFLKLLYLILTFKPNIIQISSPFGIILTKIVIKLTSCNAILVYDAHNVESDMYSFYVKNIFERISILPYSIWQEKLATTFADHVLSVSELDKQRFLEKFSTSQEKISVIPSGINLKNKKYSKKHSEKKNYSIVFHGSYLHTPNREAIKIIRTYIAPKVLEKIKSVNFFLAGAGMPKFCDIKVNSLGFVDDLDSFLSKADIAIVPISSGSGTRIKILDYMAAALPIVTTKKGIEGINVLNYKHAIVTEKIDNQFIDAIIELIMSTEIRKKLGLNARKLVEKNYQWDEIGSQLCGIYKESIK